MTLRKKSAYYLLIGLSILLTVVYLAGQTLSMIDCELATSFGLNEPKEQLTKLGLALNKEFGFADVFVYLPLLIVGIIFLIKKSTMGFFAMCAAMAITIYWPVVSMSTLFYAKGAPGFTFDDFLSYSIFLSIIAFFGLWGFVFLYRNRKYWMG